MDRQEINKYREGRPWLDCLPDGDVEKIMVFRQIYPGTDGLTARQCLEIIRDMEANGEELPTIKAERKEIKKAEKKQKASNLFGWG